MAELTHYIGSHTHESRLRDSAELEVRPSASGISALLALRREGIDVVDSKVKKLVNEVSTAGTFALTEQQTDDEEAPVHPQGGTSASRNTPAGKLEPIQPSEFVITRMQTFDARLRWRRSMDTSLKRLLIDTELCNDNSLKDFVSHRLRCEHLDKTYNWYSSHGMKEVRKERKALPYLVFDPTAPVMPGSLRPKEGSEASLGGGKFMQVSSSSPALPALRAVGATTLFAAAPTRP